MIARILGPARPSRPRRLPTALLALLLVLAVVAAHALAPALFRRATLQNELAVQLKATSGLRILARHARFVLLPRPRVVADEVRIDDSSGAVTLDADGLSGDVRLLPLVVGRIELSGVTLRRPRLAVDLAAGPLLGADSTVGRALRGRDGGEATAQRLGSLTLADGTIRVARAGAPPLVVSGIDATIDWSDLESAASLTGSLALGGERVDLALWLGSPSGLLRGDASAVSLHGHAAALDIAAKGVLTTGVATAGISGGVPSGSAGEAAGVAFRGRVSAGAAALGQLIARAAPSLRLPADFADAALDGEVRVTADRDGPATIDVGKLTLRADGNDWEGTLAFRRGPRPLVSATLATGQLMLAPFAAGLPAALDGDRRWSAAPLPRLRIGDVDLDLRVSAAHLVCRPYTVDEAAMAVISRNGRLEIALIDGQLTGGTLKARLSLGRAGADGVAGDLDLRGSASLTGADASALSWDTAGRPLATGTLSGSLSVESRGDSIAALIGHLAGAAKASLSDGDIAGLGSSGGRVGVRSLDVSATLAGGLATIAETTLDGPDVTLAGHGTLDLRTRRLDLRAMASRPGDEATQGAPVVVSGPLDAIGLQAGAPVPAEAR